MILYWEDLELILVTIALLCLFQLSRQHDYNKRLVIYDYINQKSLSFGTVCPYSYMFTLFRRIDDRQISRQEVTVR